MPKKQKKNVAGYTNVELSAIWTVSNEKHTFALCIRDSHLQILLHTSLSREQILRMTRVWNEFFMFIFGS